MLEMIQTEIPAEFNELGEMTKEATAEISNLLYEENICIEVIPKEKNEIITWQIEMDDQGNEVGKSPNSTKWEKLSKEEKINEFLILRKNAYEVEAEKMRSETGKTILVRIIE